MKLRELRALRKQLIVELYADYTAPEIGALLGCSENAIYKKAHKLGLSKTSQAAVMPLNTKRPSGYTGGTIESLPGGVLRHWMRG